MNKGAIVLISALGVGAGASAFYLLDPKEGARRRRRVRDKAIVLGYEARRQSRKAMKTARRATDTLAELLANRATERQTSLDELAERIQTKVAKLVSYPGVKVTTRNGKVTLSGAILADEAAHLLAKVAAMKGVDEVVDKLEPIVPESGHEVRAGNGGSAHRGLTGHSWSASERVLASAGSTLGLLGLGILTRTLIARRV